jgi:predicted nuclease of predicted toxin-antitoxin system
VRFLFDQDVPDELRYILEQMRHEVSLLRHLLPTDASDSDVLQLAHDRDQVLVTCNRDDFIELAKKKPHRGIIIVIRRKTRSAEKAALFRLLERAGESGLKDNINFA